MKLVIATGFTGGMGFAPFLVSLTDTLRVLKEVGVDAEFWSVQSAAYVDDMRNAHVARFLKTDATHLVFLDYDMEWSPEGFCRLLTANRPVVGGTYRVKNAWMRYTANLMERDGQPVGIKRDDGDGFLIEAHQIAMGFTCIKREVFEAMRDADPDTFYTQGHGDDELVCHDWFTRIREGTYHYGEDYAFSLRWKRLGGQLWVDPNITLNHWGLHGFKGNQHEEWLEQVRLRERFPAPVAVAAE
jgi:hypothetical protein